MALSYSPHWLTTMKSLTLLFVSMLLISSVGCQQRSASKLLGRWEGRPDSAALRLQREAKKYGEVPSDNARTTLSEVATGSGSATRPHAPSQVTDWENYDVTVLFDFVSSERLEMSLDGEQPRSGRWKIVSTSPVGYTIEVQTEKESTSGEGASVLRRQFELLLDERGGTCVGFLLTEVGADRQQGALYFQRPEKSNSVQSD